MDKDFKVCPFSLFGFYWPKYPEKYKEGQKKIKFIEKNCEHWGYFGDGLCYSCHYKEGECKFPDMLPEDWPKEETDEKFDLSDEVKEEIINMVSEDFKEEARKILYDEK